MLSNEELQVLEPELKQFLIVNGIHHEEWERMNQMEPNKSMALVELFSDTVLQKVYQKIEFLEYNNTNRCLLFQIDEAEITCISIQPKPGVEKDLSSPEQLHYTLKNEFNSLDFFFSKKKVAEDRETEIHQLVEQGCIVSSKEIWSALQEVLNV